MKKILLLIVVALSAIIAHAQSQFFKDCEKIPGITTVYVSKTMLSMIGTSNIVTDGINLSSLASKIESIEIIQADGRQSKAVRQKIDKLSTEHAIENLLKVNDGGQQITLYMKELPGSKYSYTLTVDEKDETTVILFTGKLTIAEVMEAIGKKDKQK